VATYLWSSYPDVVKALNASSVLNVVVGYSGGGSRATWVADDPTKPRIDLMILYDPSPSWQMEDIGLNVAQAICYHNMTPLMLGLGGGVLKGSGKITTINISEQHIGVQFDQKLHAQTVAAVEGLLAKSV
jgi:hypothetical protein